MPTDYTTLALVKSFLGQTGTDQDTAISAIISGVSALFDIQADGEFSQESKVEYHSGFAMINGIVAGDWISEDGTDRAAVDLEQSGETLTIDVDFLVLPFPSRLILAADSGEVEGARFPVGDRNLKLTYLTAYKVVPADVELAALEESARSFKKRNTPGGGYDRLGISSRTPEIGTGTTYAPDDLSPSTLRMLRGYSAFRSF